jgi:hypothetical protein
MELSDVLHPASATLILLVPEQVKIKKNEMTN